MHSDNSTIKDGKLVGAEAPPGARILVVDDSAVVRKVVTQLLRAHRHEVTACASGEEAFAKLLEMPFDAVVTDVIMGALSGIQLCRLVRSDAEMANTPVILLTAAYDPRSRFWGAHSGADACLAKEAMNKELVPTLAHLLETRGRAKDRPDNALHGPVAPLERLSQVLDKLLYQAVISAEVRRVLSPGDDRTRFCEAITALASQVTDYAYLVLRLNGTVGPTWCVHARAPWPGEGAESVAALTKLGLGHADPAAVQIVRGEEANRPGVAAVDGGERASFPVLSQGEALGEITAYGGHKHLGPSDRATLELFAQELGLVLRSLFLMEQTTHMANTDALTGLHNRHRTNEYLIHEVERSRRYGTPLSAMIADVDHFKAVNDKFGHAAGDATLKRIADVLRRGGRNTDITGRWGGEEFLILLPSTELPGAEIAAERLRAVMESEKLDGDIGKVTFSAGVACFDGKESADSLVNRADRALYEAKQAGRNKVVLAK